MKCFPCICKQYLLCKQITTCIAGNTQFRKYNNFCSLSKRLFDSLTYLFRIVCHICHPDIRCYGRHFYKSVSHDSPPILFTSFYNSLQIFYCIIISRVTEMTFYFDVFSFFNHFLYIFLSNTCNCLFYTVL